MSTATLETAQPTTTTQTEVPGLLDQILDQTKSLDDQERLRNKTYIEQFIRKAVKPDQIVSKDAEANIKFWIAELDKKLSAQLNQIMHNADFQKLEGTWRGLSYLV